MKKLLLFISALVSASLYTSTSIADNRLEEVYVTSSGIETTRDQIGTSVSVIKQDEIELRGYQSFADLMATQMSISTTGSGGLGKAANLRIRGEEGYRTLILIDGVETSDPTATQGGPQVQHFVNAGDIERIEILRGPQGFIYGADAGGVINILTRRAGEGSGGGVFVEAGSFDSQKLNAYYAGGNDRADLFASVTQLDSEGFNARADDPENEDDGYNNLTGHLKLGWNFAGEKLPKRVQLVLRNVNAESEFDACYYSGDTINDCLGSFDQTIGKLSVDFAGEQYSQAMSLSRTSIKRENRASGESTYATAGSIETFAYRGDLAFSDAIKIVMGFDGEKHAVEVDGGDDLQRDQLGLFSEAQLSFGEFYFNIGARYDDNEDFGEHLSTRLSAAYILALNARSYLKLRSSYGTGFRAPSLFEIDYNRAYNTGISPGQEGLPPLVEEQSQGVDLGIEYHHEGGAYVELAYFDQKITDEISFDLTAWRGYLQYAGESKSSGVEMAFSYPLISNVSVQGNYTYNDTENADALQRARRPEVSFNVGLQGLFIENSVSLLINYREVKKRVDYVGGTQTRLDDYGLMDISARYAFSEGLKAFVRAENALDEKYADIGGFNTAGLAFYAGFQYHF